jgi:hypothetical protein
MVKYIPPIGPGFESRVKAYMSSHQYIPSGSYTIVNFNSVIFDGFGEFDTTNYRFVAKEAGYYQFNVKIMFSSFPSGYYVTVRVLQNGNVYNYGRLGGTGQDLTINLGDIVYLAAGDELKVDVYQNSGSAQLLIGTYPQASSFSVHRLS